MTARKFDRYTLWLRWNAINADNTRQWRRYMVCLELGFPAANARKFLFTYAWNIFPGPHWPRKNWMVLGGDKVPAGYVE